MHTIFTVWVLMTGTTHDWVSPAMEFSSEERCIAAAQEMRLRAFARSQRFNGFCMKVEK